MPTSACLYTEDTAHTSHYVECDEDLKLLAGVPDGTPIKTDTSTVKDTANVVCGNPVTLGEPMFFMLDSDLVVHENSAERTGGVNSHSCSSAGGIL